ncbi:unnamed protein product [Cuscuta epithymum]|uniref:Uncharacterized protein n=1 Tax=Cuscuta epithymum TaxID=186058 RepID=A0AAV0GGY6_9ASTE|nr:unnamed protein product [Cuscuta epithymum]
MFWDLEAQGLLGKAAQQFNIHLDAEKLAPKSLPEEIKELVGKELIFKIDKVHENRTSGGVYYSIGMISEDREKIEHVKAAVVLQSEAYNSDDDLELLSYSTIGVESSMTPSSVDNENVPTPHSSISKRVLEGDPLGSETGSSLGSSVKKQKFIKLEME